MTKYEVIESIMNDSNLDETAKVWKIEMFLKGWITAEQIEEAKLDKALEEEDAK